MQSFFPLKFLIFLNNKWQKHLPVKMNKHFIRILLILSFFKKIFINSVHETIRKSENVHYNIFIEELLKNKIKAQD